MSGAATSHCTWLQAIPRMFDTTMTPRNIIEIARDRLIAYLGAASRSNLRNTTNSIKPGRSFTKMEGQNGNNNRSQECR